MVNTSRSSARSRARAGLLPALTWREFLRKHRCPVDVLERHEHSLGAMIDVHLAEKLEPGAGRQVGLARRWRLLEDHRRSKGVVEGVRTEAACMQRTGDEFPKGIEVTELSDR